MRSSPRAFSALLILTFCVSRTLVFPFPGLLLSSGAVTNSNRDHVNGSSENATTSVLVVRPQRSPFAYAFLVSGCHPEKPAYRYFLYSVLVATRLLRETGSTADIVIFFQLGYSSSHETLPEDDIRLLHGCNITEIHYIPKSASESYYRSQFDKFRILGLTKYRRVLFLDADVMPVSNLDYIFHLSDAGILKENLVMAGPLAPANGGFFLVSPGQNELEELNSILETRERLGRGKGIAQFDPIQGWGHAIAEPDYWITRTQTKGQIWNFYAAFADQGLLYHWVKYAKKSVSIVIGSQLEQWGVDSNGTIKLESSSHDVLQNFSKPIMCWSSCFPIYGDHVHFGGKRKPWLHLPPSNLTKHSRLDSSYHLWFWTLMELNDQFDIGLDFKNWTAERPTLGMKPSRRHASKTTIRLMDTKRDGSVYVHTG
jgi:hypothetical protein